MHKYLKIFSPVLFLACVILIIFFKTIPIEKLWKDYLQHEGMVVKSFDYDKEKGRGFSFKVKNLAYAEKGLKEIAKACRDLENKK